MVQEIDLEMQCKETKTETTQQSPSLLQKKERNVFVKEDVLNAGKRDTTQITAKSSETTILRHQILRIFEQLEYQHSQCSTPNSLWHQ